MELPGKIENISIKTSIDFENNKYNIIFTAKKVIEEDENIQIYIIIFQLEVLNYQFLLV